MYNSIDSSAGLVSNLWISNRYGKIIRTYGGNRSIYFGLKGNYVPRCVGTIAQNLNIAEEITRNKTPICDPEKGKFVNPVTYGKYLGVFSCRAV